MKYTRDFLIMFCVVFSVRGTAEFEFSDWQFYVLAGLSGLFIEAYRRIGIKDHLRHTYVGVIDLTELLKKDDEDRKDED